MCVLAVYAPPSFPVYRNERPIRNSSIWGFEASDRAKRAEIHGGNLGGITRSMKSRPPARLRPFRSAPPFFVRKSRDSGHSSHSSPVTRLSRQPPVSLATIACESQFTPHYALTVRARSHTANLLKFMGYALIGLGSRLGVSVEDRILDIALRS